MRRALFLDRDGVINVDRNYVHRIEDIEFLPDLGATLAAARDARLDVVIVTNQAGIGRGYYSVADFERLMLWMTGELDRRGFPVLAVYHCPYHRDGIAPWNVPDHPDRKPNPGMLLRAGREHGIDLGNSLMIGDQISDMEAGLNAGLSHLGWFGGEDRGPSIRGLADHLAAAGWIAEVAAAMPGLLAAGSRS
jgi:D-glycero-D-manno-heptose 1,7-bisphosphate phosphatase